MDGKRFDNLTRSVARATSRRTFLASVGAGLAGLVGGASALAAPRCKRLGQRCHSNADCCPEQNNAICAAFSGQCEACPAGSTVCGGACVATACAGGQVFNPTTCQCSCPGGTIFCANTGTCRDLNTDERACGSCATICAAGATCLGGVCTCPSGSQLCGSVCRDILFDEQNCGGCGQVCSSGAVCTGGQCECPLGTAFCPGANQCVDVFKDPSNCGACGTVCPTGASCTAGACLCPATAPVVCGDSCVDVLSDGENCGACGVSCEFAQYGQSCFAGTCCYNGPGNYGCNPDVNPNNACCSGVCLSNNQCQPA
jgi:hypothetical protein